MADPEDLADLAAGIYRRGTEEFSRFVGFSDGVFGFAMTLLISTVAIPVVTAGDLGSALRDQMPDLISYFVSFVVIGRYWLAHHRMFAAFGFVSARVVKLNLVVLVFIAFMPFPTALFGRYTEAALSVIVYAAAMTIVSLGEVLMLVAARRERALRVPLDDPTYRFVIVASVIPVFVFVASAVVALFATGVAPFVWILIIPAEWLVARGQADGPRYL